MKNGWSTERWASCAGCRRLKESWLKSLHKTGDRTDGSVYDLNRRVPSCGGGPSSLMTFVVHPHASFLLILLLECLIITACTPLVFLSPRKLLKMSAMLCLLSIARVVFFSCLSSCGVIFLYKLAECTSVLIGRDCEVVGLLVLCG